MIQQNFAQIELAINRACARANRDAKNVRLVAVGKKQPVEKVSEYLAICAAAGVPAVLGENYVQEWRDKRALLSGEFESHLIGPLQSNKVRAAVKLFDVIESVHTTEILEEINHEAGKAGKIQSLMLQVNVSGDPAKKGFAPGEIPPVVAALPSLAQVKLIGLMTITELFPVPEQARSDFRRLAELAKSLTPPGASQPLALSMGMSQDFEIAIEEGATHVRIGTALYGERS